LEGSGDSLMMTMFGNLPEGISENYTIDIPTEIRIKKHLNTTLKRYGYISCSVIHILDVSAYISQKFREIMLLGIGRICFDISPICTPEQIIPINCYAID
jgi:hypothetical protein